MEQEPQETRRRDAAGTVGSEQVSPMGSFNRIREESHRHDE